MKRLIWVICWIVLGAMLGAEEPSPALACTGGPLPLDWALSRAATVVQIQIIEVDSSHQNAIIRVENYLAGSSGPEYLSVVQMSPVDVQAELNNMNGCESSEYWLEPGEHGVLFLDRRSDGSYYTTTSPGFSPSFLFEDREETTEVMYLSSPDSDETITTDMTEDELIDLIEGLSGEIPAAPDRSTPYSLHAPLLLTTETGNTYMLPLDFGDPIWIAENADQVIASDRWIGVFSEGEFEMIDRFRLSPDDEIDPGDRLDCPTFECAEFSENGLYFAYQFEQNVIHFCETVYFYCIEDLAGEGFAITPSNRSVAVWHNSEIIIYGITVDFLDSGMHFKPFLNVVVRQTINLDETHIAAWSAENSLWSADGRWLAYGDAEGLWVWDVFSQTQPSLIVTASDGQDIAVATGISSHGRYLNVNASGEIYTLDVSSGTVFPLGIVSPTEDYLVSYDAEAGRITQICTLTPLNCVEAGVRVQQAPIWIGDHEFFRFDCYGEFLCNPYAFRMPIIDRTPNEYWEIISYYDDDPTAPADAREGLVWCFGSAFNYDPAGDNLVILNNETTISIGYTTLRHDNVASHYDDFVTINLEGKLDSDIVSVEWLPSMFIKDGY